MEIEPPFEFSNNSKPKVRAGLFENGMKALAYMHQLTNSEYDTPEIYARFRAISLEGSMGRLALGGGTKPKWYSRHAPKGIAGEVKLDSFEVHFLDSTYTAITKVGEPKLNPKNLLVELLNYASEQEQYDLAVTAIKRSELDIPHDFLTNGYYQKVLSAFTSVPGGLEVLLDAVSDLESSNTHGPRDTSSNRDTEKMIDVLNDAMSKLFIESDTKSGENMFSLINSRGFLQERVLTSIALLRSPVVAMQVSALLAEKDLFAETPPQNRQSLANLFLHDLLKQMETDSSRHKGNTEKIRKVLFTPNSYKRVLALNDLLILANSFTSRMNETRTKDKQQDLLPVGGLGPNNLVNCGEAIFRVLAVTATNPEHVEENRAYAEIFDGSMECFYTQFEKARPVTIADICARYPDAHEDILLELQEVVSREGYSAASKYYKKLSREHGSHVRNRKRKPGYGVIS